jgi:galactitol-specific phosphotransferase system IIB component
MKGGSLMADNKLIVCVCGAGINTSLNAEQTLIEYLEKFGIKDVEVKHAMIDALSPYVGRKNTVFVWMTKIVESVNMPSVQGLAFLTGGRKAKEALTREIIELMEKIQS